MQIQVNTDRHVQGGEDLIQRVQMMVEGAVDNYADRITRIEAHLSDENSAAKGGDDKRCVLEARLNGLEPIAVTHHANTMQLAIDGATEKLERAISSTLGRLSDQ
jgi:ribosome-associated translation inhibitor RaiA